MQFFWNLVNEKWTSEEVVVINFIKMVFKRKQIRNIEEKRTICSRRLDDAGAEISFLVVAWIEKLL